MAGPVVVLGLGAILLTVTKYLLALRIATIAIKVATRVLLFGIVVAAFLAVLVSIQTAINSLNAVAPPLLITVYSWFVPSNFAACLTALVTVQLIIWAWHWKKYAFDFLAGGVS